MRTLGIGFADADKMRIFRIALETVGVTVCDRLGADCVLTDDPGEAKYWLEQGKHVIGLVQSESASRSYVQLACERLQVLSPDQVVTQAVVKVLQVLGKE